MPADLPADQLAPHLSLALTLATRLCHDLAGTVGALSGALQMVADGQEADALPLAQDCTHELVGRLRLLRAAFSVDGGPESLTEVAAGLPGADRLTVQLSGTAQLDGTRRRLATNLLLLAAQALPRGGTIGLSAGPANITLDVAGPRAAWPVALARSLSDPAILAEMEAQPREMPVVIVCLLAAAMNMRISLETATRLHVG